MDAQTQDNTQITAEQEATQEVKNSNRSWTQAEVDRHVAELLKRETSKYKDYEEKDNLLKQLLTEKEKKELEGKTESERYLAQLEKTQKELQTLAERNKELEQYATKYEMESKRAVVLGDPKYSSLPNAYKKLIALSSNEDEIRASAESVLEEYKKDFGEKALPNFGIPAPKKETVIKPQVQLSNPEDLRSKLQARISAMLQK